MNRHLKPSREKFIGALGAVVVVVALFIAAFASNNLHFSGAAVKTAITSSADYGKLQAEVHPQAIAKNDVPFLGPFAYRTKGIVECGPAVRLMEGALRRTKPPIRTSPAASCVGTATRAQIRLLQKRNGIPQTGIYGTRTHKVLSVRYTKTQVSDLTYLVRKRQVAAHNALIVRERHTVLVVTSHATNVAGGSLPYTQGPQRSYFPPWPRIPPDTDCSGYATWVLYQSGVGARVRYFGPGSSVGWTGTLQNQGALVSPNQPLQVGDLVFYGHPIGHVAVYIGHGRVSSHGGPGINTPAYNYRAPTMIRRYIY